MNSNGTRSGVRGPVAERVEKRRRALRAAGLCPIKIWVPDVHSKNFATQAKKQSMAIARSAHEPDDIAFIESIAD